MKKYYMAYEDRYRQVHKEGLLWESQGNSQVVIDTIKKYNISQCDDILDLGCGEGRDSIFLLKQNYKVVGVDCSKEGINTCKKLASIQNINCDFRVLDLVNERLEKKFDFIYSMAVLHMLCTDEDRKSFYNFIYNSLKQNGKALICVLCDKDGEEFTSDYKNAFEIKQRVHMETKKVLNIATTSCRMLKLDNLIKEAKQNNFELIECFRPDYIPGFNDSMIAMVISPKI